MVKTYHHLTYNQRLQIYILKARGDAKSKIARSLKVYFLEEVPKQEKN